MRPTSRTVLGVATATVLAVTAVAPSTAAAPEDDSTGNRPLVGSEASARAGERAATVTLVTGDRILVSRDAAGDAAASALPREDGTVPFVQTRRSGEDLYVYPERATAALAAGRVDEELFNVTGLVRQGYDDAATGTLPLIAVYGTDLARSAPPAAPRGARRGQVLKAVDGVALQADKKRAATFWAEVEAPAARTAGGLRKLRLDRKAEATLEHSTRQVHAPEAWAAGFDGTGTKVAVLDTGADVGHPDLKGRVVASRDFTDSDGVDDRQGHGTHTISTVGGSGAASGGKKKGVAPGTDLLNGKVLDDSGSGAASWIIAGMEWAVAHGADVVSMSLGSPVPTDCTDPMSTAAQQLAQNRGTFAAPGTRTEYYTPGDTRWEQVLSPSFPFGEFMRGTAHAYTAGEKRTERWYDGVVAPTAPRDAAGKPVLVAERQGNLIGFADALWGDSTHDAQAGSFGDIGNVRLSRDGEPLGESAWPFGVFEVPSANGAYTLEQNVMKIGSKVWERSTSVNSVWKFTSKLDESVYSQGIPILFPRYTLPEDGLKTLAATDDQKIGLTATGHAGYTPAALTSARLSYSYDGGTTWTEAQVSRQDGAWTATVNHAGAAGRSP